MNNVRKVSVFLFFFVVLVMFMGVVSAFNWTVNPGDSIQGVIDNASSNDTILVSGNGSAYTL